MSIVRLQNVTMRYEDKLVLREAYLRLSPGDRLGLIGRNGSGKTTILRLILGREDPSAGSVEVDPGVRIGYFSQFSELSGEKSIDDMLESLFSDVHVIEEQLLEIETALEDGPEASDLGRLVERQAQLFAEMERRGGWTYQNRIDTVLTKLGFNEAHRHRPIDQLSGGWRNRAALAKILLEEPDVLLLDEPTNFLDIAGLSWLEDWLGVLRGAAIVVSHDRHFLDTVVNRIIEIENYHLHEYGGSFTQYVREKRVRIKTLEKQFAHEEELLDFEAEAISDRREAAKNPDRALKRKLANIKRRAEPRPVDKIVTGLYQGLHVRNNQCQVEAIGKAYDEQVLFRGLTFEIHRGDRIAIVGPNGCGKTTLLEVLAEIAAPDTGRAVWLGGSAYAYYNQIFEGLDLDDTVSHSVNVVGIAFRAPRRHVHRFLSLLRFSELDLRQRIGTLSGGERARVALAQCLLSGASTILLDEPTNHLDLTSTQVMERALLHFPGAVVVVSHDRFFIDKVATRLLVFRGGGAVEEIAGNWTMWQARRSRR